MSPSILTLLAAVAVFVVILVLNHVKRKASILENNEAFGEELVARERIMKLLELIGLGFSFPFLFTST